MCIHMYVFSHRLAFYKKLAGQTAGQVQVHRFCRGSTVFSAAMPCLRCRRNNNNNNNNNNKNMADKVRRHACDKVGAPI